ncbi:MAG: transglycosylase SLT domain-containing protein [Chitinispirillales bacterium]|jgi:pSer/pThr/pTyr-binding forkhead associated (FHA) protein|nr:transglycosylase SLT domain-containing protein [Chitinispirillales bacterium]
MDFYIERLDKKGESPVLLAKGPTSLGRHQRNTVALPANDRCVSAYHALIYVTPDKLLLQDMQSTNGTYVNGKRIQGECVVQEGDEIGLGMSGPRFRVVRSGGSGVGAADVGVTPKHYNADISKPPVSPVNDNSLVTPTVTIKTKPAIPKYIITVLIAAVMLTALILVMMFTSGGTGKTKPPSSPSPKFTFTHGEISSEDIDDEHASTGRGGMSTDRSIVEERIDVILRRFGERDYQIPAEMIERVEYYLNQYTGRRRRTIAMFMERRKQYFPMIRRVFTEKNIPLDLAYVSIVESGLDPYALSHAGAKGLWQFMPRTARAYGLEVSAHRDERTDPEKSTYAAAAYFKDLIAIFGARSSVMLCMAAYNAGETRIINALKRIDDPVNNRDFWYLYRRKWLAEETNEYIPQILALIIVSEHMKEYGFE